LAGALLLWQTHAAAGPAALHGLPRALSAGVVGGVLAGAAGWWIGTLGSPGPAASAGLAVAAAVAAVAVYGTVVIAADAADLRTVVTRRFG
jgi:putative peptidoglycan lipid II flippase